MTPYSLAFYVDVIASGTVLGAGPADDPDRVTAILGPDYAENSFDDHGMWRDYGMAEFFWSRESPDHPWQGHHFTLQVHRLPYGDGVVNPVLRERYGRFGRRLRFDRLERLLVRRGITLEEVPGADAPVCSLHWQPASQVSVTVRRAREGGYGGAGSKRARRRGDLRVGDVHAVTSSMTAEQVAWYREHYGGRKAAAGS
ncbi:hypothetical protein [Streptomyces roseicoloratus]|uniref:hypothetical protein n=1 Tax=Streptomyces roseicoloratus TaxID=2508722 RepID=UPI001009DB70|nr:hypothetical protein [Streptomyces roseicoloratus]